MLSLIPIQIPGGNPDCSHLFMLDAKSNTFKCVGVKCSAEITYPLPDGVIRVGDYLVWVEGNEHG